MEAGKRRRTVPDARVGPAVELHSDWPVKALPSLDPTLQPFQWPHGPGALIVERGIVSSILEVSHAIRMPVLSWPGLAAYYSANGVGLLGMPVSGDEAFVDSDVKRNLLMDRAHHYFNMEWKLEVLAMTSNPNDGTSLSARQSQRMSHYQLTEEHLYQTVDSIDRMRSLFDSLKPETVDLIGRCRNTTDIRKSMVVTWNTTGFLQ